MNFEEVLEHLGHFGSYQIVVYSLVCIPSLLVGIHIMASVFLMGIPKHRCFIKNCDNSLSEFEEPWFQYSVPKNDARGFNQCYRFKKATSTGNVSCLITDFSNATEKCSNWVWNKEEFQWTTVSEWNLVCEKSIFVALSGSVFMIGILVGAFAFGALADKVGRKRVFLFAPPLLVLSSVGTAFSPNYVVFILLRFITAAAISGLFQTGYVIVVEAVGVSRRLWCANMLQVVFAFGELVLALVAYFIRNWRTLELIIAGPTALLLVYYWILPESIRWYISKEKFDKARTTIEKAALWNKVEVPDSVYTSTEENIALFDQDSKKPTAGIVDLLRNPCLCRRTLNIAFNWFVNSFVYYGLSMNAGNLGGDVYVNFVALAAVEIPAVVLGTLILSCVGRRTLLSAMLLLGGLCCVVNPFIPTTLAWAGTTLAVIGKSQIAVSFAVVYVYSAEIFPTVVRNAGIGFSSMCSRIGGILAPLVANLGTFYKPLPMLIFGGAALASGLSTLFLPETRDQDLPETIKDAEDFGSSIKQLPEKYFSYDEGHTSKKLQEGTVFCNNSLFEDKDEQLNFLA